MSNSYDDIITHPHHVSRHHPPMTMRERAAQFSAFSALNGYEEAIGESGRLTQERREPDEEEVADLNRKLAFLKNRMAERPEITVTCFVPDARKKGGKYVAVTGTAVKISASERSISMADGKKIRFADILKLGGKFFPDQD